MNPVATSSLDVDDLFAPSVIADPYPLLAHLREHDPVHWNESYQLWVLTKYDDIVSLVRQPEVFSSAVIKTDRRPPYPPVDAADLALMPEVRAFRSSQLVEQDSPPHQAMREVLHDYFTPRAMESWRPFVRAAVAELLDEVAEVGEMDLLQRLAAPLPVRVITAMMGVAGEEKERLRELADLLLYINRGEPDRLRPLMEGIRGITSFVKPLIEDRVANPTNDFLSVLAKGREAGAFDHEQTLANAAVLLFAGHETTMNLICNGTLALLRARDQWERFAANPGGLARTVTEECLRYDPPVKSTQRIASEDVELRGKQIRKGDRIRWFIASANRDRDAFDNPDVFDITRQPNAHVSFGGGAHYCLGATLARVEGQEVFRALVERFPTMRVATDQLEYQPSIQFRSLRALPVRWA
jgi:cytochrome P450